MYSMNKASSLCPCSSCSQFLSPLTVFILQSVSCPGLPTGRELLIAGAFFQNSTDWLFTKFPCRTKNCYSAEGSKQTTEARHLSGKEKRGWNLSNHSKAGRLIGEEDTHRIQGGLQCLDCMFTTMKAVGLLRQLSCHPAMFLTEALSLCIVVSLLIMWAQCRPQNSELLHICFRQRP